MMDRQQIQGSWNEIKSQARQRWSKLTPQDLQQINGNIEKLINTISEKYNLSEEQARKEIQKWQ